MSPANRYRTAFSQPMTTTVDLTDILKNLLHELTQKDLVQMFRGLRVTARALPPVGKAMQARPAWQYAPAHVGAAGMVSRRP